MGPADPCGGDELRAIMRLVALDAWRLDGLPATLASLETHYGFAPADVRRYGADALAWACEQHGRDIAEQGYRTHVAGAGAAGALPVPQQKGSRHDEP